MSNHPVPGSVRVALVSLYGAVAAVTREDWPAVRLMVADLSDALEGVEDVLIVIALATLECLWDGPRAGEAELGAPAVAGGTAVDTSRSGAAAREMLAIADSYALSAPDTVSSAAWRLDAVRRGDRESATADVARSKEIGTETELVYGAIALLAAIVTRRAVQTGRSPQLLATEICMSASLAAEC